MDSIREWPNSPALTLKGTRGNRAPLTVCRPLLESAPLARVAVLNQRTLNTTPRPIPSADPRFRDSGTLAKKGEQADACSVVGSADRGARGSALVSVHTVHRV